LRTGAEFGLEYRSRASVFGWPLVHVAQGLDPLTGRVRVARGILAIGSVAVGVVALGGVALGGLTFGGVSAGIVAIGGLALGVAAFGGMAVAVFLAVGGLAVSLMYAVGGAALAPHAVSGGGADPELVDRMARWLERTGLATPHAPPTPERP
jgi:hypothetical protein